MQPLRFGLVGLGVMGAHHARVLGQLDGVDLVGVVDPVRAGDHLAGHEIASSVPTLLDRGIDCCVVAAPTSAHAEIGMQLAASGVHALIEKPLAMTVDEALQLRDAFASEGLVGAVGHVERYNAALQEMKRRVAAGQIGRILQVATRRQGPFPQRIGDVGVVKDLATHDIDITAWVTGCDFEWVAAQATYKTGRPHEDMVAISGRLSDGTITSHLVNWLSPFKERTVVVTGESGALVADTLSADLTFYANGDVPSAWSEMATLRGVTEGDVVRYAIAKPEPLMSELSAFRDAARGLPSDIVTMQQGVNVVRVAEAVLESVSTGSAVAFG